MRPRPTGTDARLDNSSGSLTGTSARRLSLTGTNARLTGVTGVNARRAQRVWRPEMVPGSRTRRYARP